jgi:hypothetical protein
MQEGYINNSLTWEQCFSLLANFFHMFDLKNVISWSSQNHKILLKGPAWKYAKFENFYCGRVQSFQTFSFFWMGQSTKTITFKKF